MKGSDLISGDMDIVSTSQNDHTVSWYENDGTSNPSLNKNVVTDTALGAYNVHAADLDEDGDKDIVSVSNIDDKVTLHVNN